MLSDWPVWAWYRLPADWLPDWQGWPYCSPLGQYGRAQQRAFHTAAWRLASGSALCFWYGSSFAARPMDQRDAARTVWYSLTTCKALRHCALREQHIPASMEWATAPASPGYLLFRPAGAVGRPDDGQALLNDIASTAACGRAARVTTFATTSAPNPAQRGDCWQQSNRSCRPRRAAHARRSSACNRPPSSVTAVTTL